MSLYLRSLPSTGARICLDLGTAMSKASVWLGGASGSHADVAPLPIGTIAKAEHALLTPSAMYVDDGRILFGPAALQRAWAGLQTKRSPIVSFKLILAAREVEQTLALKLSRSVDPTSTLRHRDALVLYLAYLDQLVRAAIASEPTLPAPLADAPRRLTSPHWQSYAEAGRVLGQLVDEGGQASAFLGAALIGPEGIPLPRAMEALKHSAGARASGYFEGIVFESHSAASAYANFSRATAPHFMVVDMGAGTTDIAAFERQPALLHEIDGTRQCCALAGDELDTILMDFVVRAGGKQKLDAEAHLWRALRLSVRDLKRELFEKGKCTFKHERKRIVVTREALAHDASFKAFCRALTETITLSLAPLFASAKSAGADSVTVLLAGGGSNLPFLGDLVKAAAAKCKGALRITVEPFGANWSLPHQHHPFAGMFPQMAIAMGGALAPISETSMATAEQAA